MGTWELIPSDTEGELVLPKELQLQIPPVPGAFLTILFTLHIFPQLHLI